MDLTTGDVLFVSGKSLISKGINWITRSKVSHVGIVYNSRLIFETHAGQNARLNPISPYENKDILVYRPELTESEKEAVISFCHKYNGSNYSMLDIATNFVFSWLKPKARRKLVSAIGTKGFMICSEITARILYGANPDKFSYLSGYEGLQPGELLDLAESYSWGSVETGTRA